MERSPTYSVIVPVYNSEHSLEELSRELEAVFSELNLSFEVIFVDDGSRDQSWQALTLLKQKHPEWIKVVRLARNFGQHNATLCGFSFASGERIITIDDDLQHPPLEIEKLHAAAEESGADIVYGIFRKKNHSMLRNAGSRSLKESARLMSHSAGKGSSFRLIRRELILAALNHSQHFLFLDEVFHWYTDDIVFAEVEHHPRKYHTSGYTSRKLFRLMGNTLLHYTTLPLKVLVYGGLVGSLITLAMGIYYLVLKFTYHVPLGYTSLIVTILFSTCILLFSLGVIGEYLRRIYLVQNKKPPYSIKKVL